MLFNLPLLDSFRGLKSKLRLMSNISRTVPAQMTALCHFPWQSTISDRVTLVPRPFFKRFTGTRGFWHGLHSRCWNADKRKLPSQLLGSRSSRKDKKSNVENATKMQPKMRRRQNFGTLHGSLFREKIHHKATLARQLKPRGCWTPTGSDRPIAFYILRNQSLHFQLYFAISCCCLNCAWKFQKQHGFRRLTAPVRWLQVKAKHSLSAKTNRFAKKKTTCFAQFARHSAVACTCRCSRWLGNISIQALRPGSLKE